MYNYKVYVIATTASEKAEICPMMVTDNGELFGGTNKQILLFERDGEQWRSPRCTMDINNGLELIEGEPERFHIACGPHILKMDMEASDMEEVVTSKNRIWNFARHPRQSNTFYIVNLRSIERRYTDTSSWSETYFKGFAPYCLSFQQEQNTLIVGERTGHVSFFDLDNLVMKKRVQLLNKNFGVEGVWRSIHDSYIAFCRSGGAGQIRVIDREDRIHTFPVGHEYGEELEAVRELPSGQLIVLCSNRDGNIYIHQGYPWIEKREQLHTTQNILKLQSSEGIRGSAISKNGKQISIGTSDFLYLLEIEGK